MAATFEGDGHEYPHVEPRVEIRELEAYPAGSERAAEMVFCCPNNPIAWIQGTPVDLMEKR